MKLFDKVKNMFTEEVEEEVQVEQVKPKKNKKNSFETIDQIKEEKKKEEEKKPVFFTDDDFNDMDLYRREEKKEKTEPIEQKNRFQEDMMERYDAVPTLPKRSEEPYEEVKENKKFKPTPIISPVYGILDKNYHKEDIVDKAENDYQAVDGLSVDSIRNKAYGTLEDELENTLFGNNSILFNDKETDESKEKDDQLEDTSDDLLDDLKEDDLNNDMDQVDKDLDDLENITMDIGKELDSLLSKKNDKEDSEDDLFDLIDNMYEGDEDDDN